MDSPRRPAVGLRVVVADANHLARRGLVDILREAGARVLAEPTTREETLQALADHTPDVLVATLDLAGASRGPLVAITRERWPSVAIVMLSENASDEALLAALQLGAAAYLPKTATPAQVVTAVVQAAAAPGAFVTDNVLSASARRGRSRIPRLTTREAEVLALVAEGLTVRQIAARLYVSEATAKSHLAGIYRKLGVTSRSQAVLAAVRMGMLPT
ncbi:MAG: response regulator transcription factor [Candidatus Nanopelagicales bacterium]